MSDQSFFSSLDVESLRDHIDDFRASRWRALGLVLLVVLLLGGYGLHSLDKGGSGAAAEAVLPRAAPASTTTTSAAGSADTTADTTQVVVQAAGAVVTPGVYRLTPNARVTDLLAAAGGPSPVADIDRVNLAAKVVDGQRVYIARKGEQIPPAEADLSAAGGATSGGPGAIAVVDLNAATLQQLDGLPGVGPATAQAILDYRAAHGLFKSARDLGKVKGIGPAKLAQIMPHVTA